MLYKNDFNMKELLPNSIQVELKLNEPELVDIETGEMIHLNGYRGFTEEARLSLSGNFYYGEESGDAKNNNCILDIDL